MNREDDNAADPKEQSDSAYPPDAAQQPRLSYDEQDRLLNLPPEQSAYQSFRRLTAAQRIVVENLVAGVDPVEACKRGGYKTTNVLKTIEDKMPDIMARVGLNDLFLAQKLKALCDARETKFFTMKDEIVELIPEGDKTRRVERNELRIETRDVDAIAVQLNAVKLAGQWRGLAIDAELQRSEVRDITVNIVHIGA